jgi:CheY-like chemotaxis protein
MQQEFETIMNEFMAKVKTHFEDQNSTLAEYEQFFSRAQELFPAYSGFVQHVVDSLSVIQENMNQEEEIHTRTAPAPKVQSVSKKIEIKSGETKKVLIVDDAEINRILMGHFFKNVPVTLEFASSGEPAIAKSYQNSFDLVLMDLQMKGMSGLDTIKAIREIFPDKKKTIIIAITNEAPTDEECQQSLSAGANEYLSKSMPREAIKEKVFEYLFSALNLSA